jgi:hypothetical protein
MDTLANYLAKPAKNDLEKVRALYVWICENIRYGYKYIYSSSYQNVLEKHNGTQIQFHSFWQRYLLSCHVYGYTRRLHTEKGPSWSLDLQLHLQSVPFTTIHCNDDKS